MDITLLASTKYVEDRYKDLKRKRPDEKEQAPASETALVGGISAAKRYEALLLSPSTSPSVVATLDQGALVATLDDLEHMWPMTLLEKKHTVLYLLLDQLAKASPADAKDAPPKRSPAPLPEDETDACESLPLSTQIAVKLFFKLLQSVRSRSAASGNFAPLGRLIEQVPAMLLDMPPLALAPEPGTKSPTVFDEMFRTIVVALPQLADVGHSLAALIGLSIKRGRLEHILLVLKQLLSMDPSLSLPPNVGTFLRELVTAVAQPTETTAETTSSTGMLMSFGKGDHGKLGHGSCAHAGCADGRCTENKSTPVVVEATRDVAFRKIDSLSTHSVAITSNGELLSWGNGDKYRLGHGDAAKEYAPRLVEAFRDKPRVHDVACGLGHTVVLLVNGDVYAWGNGGNGRLGLGDTSDQMQPCKVMLPDEIVEKESDAWLVSAVFCGASHSLAVTKHGHLFAWGKNNQGQCGVGHTNDELRPAHVSYFDEADMRVSTVAGGWEHTLMCTTDGKAFACGCGYKDSRRAGLPPVLGLGINDTDRRTKPTPISTLDQCVAVACGWDHSLAITKDGGVYSWGSGTNGKLGHGDEENRDVPTQVLGLSGKVVRDVRAGCEHTTAITASGEMYTWGHSDSGRLGHGDNVTRKTPCYVEAFAWQGVRPVAIAVGDKYNLVLVQPIGDDAGSPNQVVEATPTPLADNDTDTTMATTAWTVGAAHTTMLEQLHRLAYAYVPRENAALVEKLRQVHTHPTSSPPSLAYAVDVSASTFELLLDVLAFDGQKTKTASTLGCLHLIQANLLRFLSCPHVTLPASLLTKLHTALQTLATTMDGEIALAAATALKIGFPCFYASPAAQHALFWDLLLVPEASQSVLLDALVDPLCQDHVVLGLMGRLFGQLGSHTCAIDTVGPDASAPTVGDLRALLLRLVTSCVETSPEKAMSALQLRVLSVLQTHVFACWHAPSVYCIDCVGAVLGPYLESLFGQCLVLLKAVHRRLLKDSDLSTLQPSFFHALAPLAIECCCVSRLRSSESFGLRLLPTLLPMLKLLDEITYKATQDTRSSNQSPSMDLTWISELENALALLVGRYTSALIGSSRPVASPSTTIPTPLRLLCRYGQIVDGTPAPPSALRRWEESGVFEVENELQGDMTPPPDVTLEHIAICDWWAGHGVLQHLDKWMRYHMQLSWLMPLASVESTRGIGPLLLWHAGLAATALAFASSLDVQAPLEPGAPPTPPEPLLQLWTLLTSLPVHVLSEDVFLEQARRLLTYYPSQCSWTLATTDTTPPSHCSFPNCTLFGYRAYTLSVPHLVALLQSPLSWSSERDDDRISFKIAGLSILHDLLRKLTSSAAKCELLRVLNERLEVDVDAGCLSVAYNAWQEPRVVFASPLSSSPRKSKRRRDSDASPLQLLERDLHAFHGHAEHGKLAKAIENLYVRSAKILASAESDPLLKKRALTLWTVHFHDVGLIRRAGILHILGDLLATDAPPFAMNAAADVIYGSSHAAPAHSCLPPRLRPVEKLVAGATTARSLHNAAWHVFGWLGRQLMLSTEASTEALSRPSSAKPSLHCTSPRKRLSLPPKLISASLDESLAHTYMVVIDELRRVTAQLASWNALAHSMVQCLDDSQAILLADPNVVSGTNAVFLSAKERASFDWSTDGFAISLFLHIERDEKEASATSGASMLLLANGDVTSHQLALTLCLDGRVGLQLRIEETSVEVAVLSARPLVWGHWTHLVGRFNPTSRRLEVFLNGILDAQSDCIETTADQSVLSHHTFTVGGFVPSSGIPPPHPPHLLLDDVAFHLHALSEETIGVMASAGSLLFRIQQRQVLDTYCDHLLSLLVAPSRALPPVDDVVSLVVALFPVAPPRSHDKLFSLLTNLLPALPPASVLLRESALSFMLQCYSSAWFGSTYDTYGPPGLSAALSTRKDSVLLHLLNARQLDPNGVATWLLFEQPVKAKSLPLLRASRARLATGVVALLAHLLQSPLWQPTLLAFLEAWIKSAESWTGQRGSLADTATMAKVVLAVNVVAATPGGYPLPEPLPTLVAWSLTSPISMAGHEAPTTATPASSTAEMREDIQLAQHVHLRSSLLRLCRLQAQHTAVVDALLKPGLIGFLQLAIQPLAEAVATVFGSDFDIISKLDTVQALLEWILDDAETPHDGGSKRRAALAMLSTVLFERLPYVNPREVAPWWLVNATQKLQVLGGDVEMEEYRVKGLQHFPTIKLTGVSITAGTGMWFYEVVLLTDGLMQIGWVDTAFEANAIQGQGVGDHTNSWAYDGFRRKKWNVGALEYGDRWHVGDVVGVLLDTDRFEMTYFLNGRSLGVAFEGLHLTHALFPAMSLNVDQAVQLHFAKNQFLYCPTLDNAKLQPVASAIVGGVCEHSPSKGRLSVETDHEAAIDRRRTDLIDGLVGLGFSPEWALRCARETSLDINESAAIAWIMEQMEADALAARPSHASHYRMHHLQQLDGLGGHVDKPALLTVDRPQWAVVADADVAAPSTEPRNALLLDETCEEVYADEGLVVHDPKLPSTSEKRSVGFILSLADHCRDDEILPLYVIAETVLCVWSAQEATHELFRSGSLARDETLAQHAPLFLQYLQRRLLDEATATDNGGPYEALLQQLCGTSPAFFELLVRDLLGHVHRATAKDMVSTPFAPGHASNSAGPNLAWARWLAAVLRRLATTDPTRTDVLYAPAIWQELWVALSATANATVRHAVVSILVTLLNELPSTTMEALQLHVRVKHLIEWLGEKLRKTKQARVLASAYTQAIFELTSCLYRYVNPRTSFLVAAPPVVLPVLLVEHVTSSTVVLSCPVDGATALELAMETVHSNGHVGVSDFIELVDPVDLHRHMPYTLSHLQPETVYHVRCIFGETRSPATVLETLPESVLELDPAAIGSNLELLHHNMTARNRINKKWHAVRASVGFTSGVHAWDVRIDKCVSKNIFVGVCTADACLDNYVGSDAYGWGFLANKAVWHNKTKLQTYGDIFKQGDVVSVVLDLDAGTLAFARNGDSFGVAVENLHGTHHSVVAPAYFPAISMYNKDDQVTLLPSTSDAPVRSAVAGASTVLVALTAHHKLLEMTESLSLASTAGAYDHWCKWIHRDEAVVTLDDGAWLLLTTTHDACLPFGLFAGDVIFTSKGMCTVLGVAKHELYYSIEAHAPTGSPDAIGRWKVHLCRDMVGRPSEFPVTRRHDAPHPVAPTSLSHEAFLDAQRPWTPALDEALLQHVYTTVHFQRYTSVFDVRMTDLEPVPLALTPIESAARVAWLRYLNLQAQVVVPCVSLADASMQCLRRRLFRFLPLRFARDLLKKTATATTLPATAADELDDDPPDLIKCNVRASSRPSFPFWETSGVDADDTIDDDEVDTNVFSQLAAFLTSAATRELRRQYAPPPPPYADVTAPTATRTFRVHWEAPDATLPLEPAVAYAHVLKEAARAVQSPTYPLLAPTRQSSTLWLNISFLRPRSNSPADCFALGQLVGIAWRSDVHLPWYFGPLLWKLLARESVTLDDWAPVVDDDATDVAVALAMPTWSTDDFASHAIPWDGEIVTLATAPRYIAGLLDSLLTPYKPYVEAMQRGLVSIVPPTCLGLFSAATLAAHLCPAAKLLALQARTQYAGGLRRTSAVVAFFWRILHTLSLDEMHLLERFLVGPHWSPYGTLQLTLSPGDVHGGGYPSVERSATDACVLVLPLYPTQDMLHKKLLLAMTQSPDQYDDDENDDAASEDT